MSQALKLCSYVSTELAKAGSPDDAVAMQRYLKTDMPFFGVKKPAQRVIYRAFKKDFAPADDAAAHLVGKLALDEREPMRPVLEAWVDDDDLWIRRTAILAQLRHKDATDEDMLFAFCARRAHEKVFWIRKAIGWVLRDYARTNAAAVRDFVVAHRDTLSGLSVREAKKGVARAGLSLDDD